MRYLAPVLIALLLGAVSAAPSEAQPNRAREGVQSGDMRSLGEILNGIRRERPGNLADVQGPNMGPAGEPHYRLKWLTPDGRVLWLDTDARTGRVMGVEGDDRGPPGPPPPPPRGRFGPFGERRGNFYPDGPPVGPPNGYQGATPGGVQRGLPPGYDRRPPGAPGAGPNRGYDRGPPAAGPQGRFRRFRDGR
jgi:hypothetical protein